MFRYNIILTDYLTNLADVPTLLYFDRMCLITLSHPRLVCGPVYSTTVENPVKQLHYRKMLVSPFTDILDTTLQIFLKPLCK